MLTDTTNGLVSKEPWNWLSKVYNIGKHRLHVCSSSRCHTRISAEYKWRFTFYIVMVFWSAAALHRGSASRNTLLSMSRDTLFPSVKSLLIFRFFSRKLLFFRSVSSIHFRMRACPFKKSKMQQCPNKEKIKHFQLLWIHKRLPIIAEFFNWQISICSFLLKFHLLWQLLVSTNSISQCVSYYRVFI